VGGGAGSGEGEASREMRGDDVEGKEVVWEKWLGG